MARIVYLTRLSSESHAMAHEVLAEAGYPDGPILMWRRKRVHLVRSGRMKLPRVVFDTRLISQLGQLKRAFANLNVGICESALAAEAFADAQMRCVVIGDAKVAPDSVTRCESWADLDGEAVRPFFGG